MHAVGREGGRVVAAPVAGEETDHHRGAVAAARATNLTGVGAMALRRRWCAIGAQARGGRDVRDRSSLACEMERVAC
jgi:hypothetical protein